MQLPAYMSKTKKRGNVIFLAVWGKLGILRELPYPEKR